MSVSMNADINKAWNEGFWWSSPLLCCQGLTGCLLAVCWAFSASFVRRDCWMLLCALIVGSLRQYSGFVVHVCLFVCLLNKANYLWWTVDGTEEHKAYFAPWSVHIKWEVLSILTCRLHLQVQGEPLETENLWRRRTFLVLVHRDRAAVSPDAPPIWLREAHLFNLSKGGFYYWLTTKITTTYMDQPTRFLDSSFSWSCSLDGALIISRTHIQGTLSGQKPSLV